MPARPAPTVAAVTVFREFSDPRLAGVYDALGPDRRDTDFYLGLAAELAASSVADIGCGTGLLACELAGRGHTVTGVDPAAAMLAVARRRPGANRVRWIEGGADRLGTQIADLAVMSGHVAQVIADDEDWRATLAATREALRPGGRVAFESRNPDARAWADWTRRDSARTADDPTGGRFEWWYELTEVLAAGALVRSEVHYRFRSGEELVSQNELRFRTRPELAENLAGAGFEVERLYGDWDRRPAGPGTPELIFVAVRG